MAQYNYQEQVKCLQDEQEILNGRYRVIRSLGSGYFSEAYLIKDKSHSFNKVLKVINRQLEKEILDDIKLLTSVYCPTMVKYYDIVTLDQKLCLILEFCSTRSVCSVIEQTKHDQASLSKSLILDWSVQILDALKFLHSKNLIHRDIKPKNLFVNMFRRVKLSDFGLSTNSGHIKKKGPLESNSTLHYMSPQMLSGSAYAEKTDVWSFGCVLVELLSLEKAFTGRNLVGVAEAVLNEEPFMGDSEMWYNDFVFRFKIRE